MTDDPVYDEPPPGVPRSALWDEDDFETPADLLEGEPPEDEDVPLPPPPKRKPIRRVVSRQFADSDRHNALNSKPKGYPYVLIDPGVMVCSDDDRYTLESEDGSYKETVTAGEGEKGEGGTLVLWFPPPHEGKKYKMTFEPDPASGYEDAEGYLLFAGALPEWTSDDDSGGGS